MNEERNKAIKIILDELIVKEKYQQAFNFLVALNLAEFEEEKQELAKKIFVKVAK